MYVTYDSEKFQFFHKHSSMTVADALAQMELSNKGYGLIELSPDLSGFSRFRKQTLVRMVNGLTTLMRTDLSELELKQVLFAVLTRMPASVVKNEKVLLKKLEEVNQYCARHNDAGPDLLWNDDARKPVPGNVDPKVCVLTDDLVTKILHQRV